MTPIVKQREAFYNRDIGGSYANEIRVLGWGPRLALAAAVILIQTASGRNDSRSGALQFGDAGSSRKSDSFY